MNVNMTINHELKTCPLCITDPRLGNLSIIRLSKLKFPDDLSLLNIQIYKCNVLLSEIHKSLTAVTKCTGGEDLKPWISPCCNHFYWSAQSTPSGNGEVIWAKFKSFLDHIVDKHENLDDPLFPKCLHGPLEGRKWLRESK